MLLDKRCCRDCQMAGTPIWLGLHTIEKLAAHKYHFEKEQINFYLYLFIYFFAAFGNSFLRNNQMLII